MSGLMAPGMGKEIPALLQDDMVLNSYQRAMVEASMAVAYEHREHLVRYITCQEEAHGVSFTCAQVRRMVFEMLAERGVCESRDRLRKAILSPGWCPGAALFSFEEVARFAGHPPCPPP